MRAQLNADPFGAAIKNGVDLLETVRQAVELAVAVASAWPQATTFLADGRPYHGGGASEAQELAFTVATAIEYLRALSDAGMTAEGAARQIAFALAADSDFFLTVAKFRALRRLWSRVLEVVGGATAMPAMRLHAETATRMLTRLDPHVNILRGTVATFAAAAGGASSITVLPFDHAQGTSSPLACRIARNTQLVLLEESNVGRVIDPAGGSWLVERLTEELAGKAWSLLQEVERRGGMTAVLRDGWPQAMVAASRERLEREVATRRAPVTGVSEFSNPAEELPPAAVTAGPLASGIVHTIPSYRLAEPFERVRARGDGALAKTGKRPGVFLATLGSRSQFASREGFARSLFEAGGFATTASGEVVASRLAEALAASGARQAAICSSDAVYAEQAEAAARALREAGARGIYLMGRPTDVQQTTWSAAGVDEFVFAGCDVLAVLDRAHERESGGRA
jgi:methylmalonyl-CoA mutase